MSARICATRAAAPSNRRSSRIELFSSDPQSPPDQVAGEVEQVNFDNRLASPNVGRRPEFMTPG